MLDHTTQFTMLFGCPWVGGGRVHLSFIPIHLQGPASAFLGMAGAQLQTSQGIDKKLMSPFLPLESRSHLRDTGAQGMHSRRSCDSSPVLRGPAVTEAAAASEASHPTHRTVRNAFTAHLDPCSPCSRVFRVPRVQPCEGQRREPGSQGAVK